MSEEKENRVEERQGGESYQLHVLTKKTADEMRGKQEMRDRGGRILNLRTPYLWCLFAFPLKKGCT